MLGVTSHALEGSSWVTGPNTASGRLQMTEEQPASQLEEPLATFASMSVSNQVDLGLVYGLGHTMGQL